MKKQDLASLFFIVAVLLISIPLQSQENDSGIKWLGFEEGLSKATAENKIILIDVYTDWCHWCKEMDKTVFNNESVADYINKNFVPVKFNAEAENRITYKGKQLTQRELSFAMGISSYPTTLFLKSDGEPITRLPGFVPADLYRNIVEYIYVGGYESATFEEWQKTKKN